MNVTVLRSGTRVPKSLSQLRNTLRNGTLVAKLGIFTLYRFAVVSQLRNRGSCAAKWHSCAKLAFTAAKILIENPKVLRNGLATKCCENSHRESQSVVEWFGNKVLFSQKFSSSCEVSQSPVFTLFLLCFCSDFFSIFFSISLHFLPPKIIQKD